MAQLEAQIRGDEAAIDSAQTQLSYTTITSPLSGRTPTYGVLNEIEMRLQAPSGVGCHPFLVAGEFVQKNL